MSNGRLGYRPDRKNNGPPSMKSLEVLLHKEDAERIHEVRHILPNASWRARKGPPKPKKRPHSGPGAGNGKAYRPDPSEFEW